MDEKKFLAERFEENRSHLRAVAYRMLGSATEAEDAVQEAWLRLNRADTQQVNNLNAWLTTVVARVCLDTLRSRKARREEALDTEVTEPVASTQKRNNPEQEAMLADSVGIALLVVLDRLSPAERLAFVLHDLFGQSFEEVAAVLDKTPAAVRQLASRARRRVQGPPAIERNVLNAHRRVVDAFLTALRARDFEGLVSVLDPNVVVRIDKFSATGGKDIEIRGAETWARGAIQFAEGARLARTVLVDGEVGVVMAPRGKLFRAVRLSISDEGRIREVEIIGEKERLAVMDVQLLPE
ncbi:RNA polymerase, sigma subunit, ECF family [Candidatus Koribacter versatilis Ellin345]|uniref:RNA polymerase, sigma subunit, ECF family n=1 Tax=Koribacter versatilis (strain Ellin345) TaxID=204669 RepID=Q1IKT7_KORVE|nr:sigma-70 family RNA polymerase sigma factor [Candidatus Koribacter versatilis]ABF42513.1 RNA polymerase, sigma subunit, ECF family [Candidatus Koribacter versatilis Ellin345]